MLAKRKKKALIFSLRLQNSCGNLKTYDEVVAGEGQCVSEL